MWAWPDSGTTTQASARRSLWLEHATALGFVLIAFLLRDLLDPLLGSRSQFILFVLAIVAAATWLGRRPAILATVAGAIAGMSLLSPGERMSAAGVYQLSLFIATSLLVIWLARRLEQQKRRALQLARSARQVAAHSRVAEEELRLLLDAAREHAIFLIDAEGRVSSWNAGAARIYGWSEEEVRGRSVGTFFAPTDGPEAESAESCLGHALADGGYRTQIWQLRKDGSEFLGAVSLSPVRDVDGRLLGYANVVHDTTEREAAERALARREELLKSILETVPDAMIVIDEEGAIISFSTAAQRLFGYDEAAVLGRNVNMLMPDPDRSRHDTYLRRHLETGERRIIGIGRIVTGLRANGETFPMKLSVGEAVSGGQRLFTGFVQDLTELQEFETKLEQARTELIHVSRVSAMGTMASTLAHELNQPLTAIANYGSAIGDLLEREEMPDRALMRSAFHEMSGQAIRAGTIVRRLRRFVARGDLTRTVEDVPALINEASALALVGSRERGVVPQFIYAPTATPVFVDRVQIQQVLVNLMRNACEAMEASPVRRLTLSTALLDQKTVEIVVADTGPGLTQDIADRLFEAFVSTKENGMGLGLSICRTIIESHGGRISARAARGGGTEFRFTLPKPDFAEDG